MPRRCLLNKRERRKRTGSHLIASLELIDSGSKRFAFDTVCENTLAGFRHFGSIGEADSLHQVPTVAGAHDVVDEH